MRVKTGTTRSKRHKKVLKRTKGFRMTKGRLYKVSKEADLHAGQYAFIGRKLKKRNFRKLWITRINAALSDKDLSYSQFINALKENKIEINRKMFCEIISSNPKTFDNIYKKIKTLDNKPSSLL